MGELRTLVYCSYGDYFSMGKDYNKDRKDYGCRGEPDEDHKSPTILQSVFPHTEESWYWSSSPYAGLSDGAWYIYFNYGHDNVYAKDNGEFVRLVRSGQ